MNKPRIQTRLSSIIEILETRAEWRSSIRFNVRIGKIEKINAPHLYAAAPNTASAWAHVDTVLATVWLEEQYEFEQPLDTRLVFDAITARAHDCPYDPFTET